jgi:hypothetical protein
MRQKPSHQRSTSNSQPNEEIRGQTPEGSGQKSHLNFNAQLPTLNAQRPMVKDRSPIRDSSIQYPRNSLDFRPWSRDEKPPFSRNAFQLMSSAIFEINS